MAGFLIAGIRMEQFPTALRDDLAAALFSPGIAKPDSLIAYHGPGYLFQPGIANVIDAIVCGNFNKTKRLLKANLGL